jgi:hypothetical protein
MHILKKINVEHPTIMKVPVVQALGIAIKNLKWAQKQSFTTQTELQYCCPEFTGFANKKKTNTQYNPTI